ncbi:NAD(P)/FAD-dependent oxidoreductase [Maritimibacter fusiformis]|uniref:NAD(P)/FAD-dependent oxidoreductase n=1 Tax=Maritimibacter fusiformis TaxID=2603819 RepID=A0A5D0RQ07_9RHOB|nr:NAD(P)/FAD-dependent oxidoreductase [Maritimibacter fusiformis]TYB82748.1 NAD(P)/FAD-dependent oxidoreductase [Maritimibacter fusiformis]
MTETYDCVIIGAGAAGLFCAARAGATGKRVLLLDHARAPGEKIRISGGGRCNFTNLAVTAANFLSENPHFAKSALARFTPADFLDLVARHRIAWHEKTLGQLFCDGKSTQIVDMLLEEMQAVGATLRLQTPVSTVAHGPDGFRLTTPTGQIGAKTLVLATGGKSIPKMGATGFAYDIARQFGHRVTETRPALVPLTFGDSFAPLAGVSTPVIASNARASFAESLLFTHRGLSGPAILQLSSYWREGEAISIDLIPGIALADSLRAQRQREGKRAITTHLAHHLPTRLVEALTPELGLTGNLADHSDKRLMQIETALKNRTLTPTGSEGYRTAEVTLGGVATEGLDSQSMMSKTVPGLFIIGEAVDVTGWLGGYNFQWAWASADAAGRAIAAM